MSINVVGGFAREKTFTQNKAYKKFRVLKWKYTADLNQTQIEIIKTFKIQSDRKYIVLKMIKNLSNAKLSTDMLLL